MSWSELLRLLMQNLFVCVEIKNLGPCPIEGLALSSLHVGN